MTVTTNNPAVYGTGGAASGGGAPGSGDGGEANKYFSDNFMNNQYFADDDFENPYAPSSDPDTLKLPGHTIIAGIGDSQMQHNITGSASAGSEELSNWSRGYINWWRMLDPRGQWINWYDANKASKFGQGHNQGISGYSSDQVLARLTDVTNIDGVKVVIFDCGTNDLNQLDDLETEIKENQRDIFDALIALGIKIIIISPTPRPTSGANSWAAAGAIRNDWMALCEWQQEQADEDPDNIQIVRADLICSDGSADREPITGYLQSDNVHRTPMCGHAIAVGTATHDGLIDCVANWVDPFVHFPEAVTPGDIATNPTCTGTGGSNNTGSSGVVCDGMIMGRGGSSSTGVTVVCSKETVDGIDYQKLVFTSTGGSEGGFPNANFQLSKSGNITTPAAAITPGHWYRGFMQFKADASPLIEGISLRCRGQPSTPANMDTQAMKSDTNLLWPNVALQKSNGAPLWQATPAMKLRPGTTSVLWNANIVINNQAAGTTTIWISRMHLVPVPDPTKALGFP